MKVKIDNIFIKAVSAWLPQNILEMSSLSKEYGAQEVETVMRTTGIERVRIADANVCASDMCQYAAKSLLEKEGVNVNEIDGLVFVSQTSDWIIPSTAIALQERLGLSKDTVCVDIHYGCSGYIYGLFQAASWIHSGACKNVLVLAGDTSSRMVNPNDRSLRMVFGDCGTATLVTVGSNEIGFHIQSDGSGSDSLIIPAGGYRLPISEETSQLMWDDDRNGRTQNDLYMNGMDIFKFAITAVPRNIKALLEHMNWGIDDVGLFALHQANEFMVSFIQKKLKVRDELVPINCREYGNTGPATIPLLLSDMCSGKHSFNLTKVVMSGFGIGLSWGSIATNLTDTHFYKPINE